MTTAPGAVLFACTLNRTRSPMAAALLRRRFGDRIHVDSCGLRASEDLDPLMLAALAEIGVPVDGSGPKTFAQLDDGSFDLVITLTRDAQAAAAEALRGCAVEIEHWPVADPTEAEGSRDVVLQAYRDLRDDLDRRIQMRFGQAST